MRRLLTAEDVRLGYEPPLRATSVSPGREIGVSNRADTPPPPPRHRLTAGFLARPPAVGPGSRDAALGRAAGGAFSFDAGGLRAAPGTPTEAERRPGGAIAAIAA